MAEPGTAHAARARKLAASVPTTVGAEDVVREVAEAHDNCCSAHLRHMARHVLGLGSCSPEQDCPFCSERAVQ